MRTKKMTVVGLLVTAGATSLLHAQPGVTAPAVTTPPEIQQVDQNTRNREQQETLLNNLTTTNAPELYPGENDDVGPQRLLKVKPSHTYFEGLVDTQFAYTDNNRLDNHARISTTTAINTVQAALAPSPYDLWSGKFAPRLGYRSQWYNYGAGDYHSSEAVLDFNAQTFFASGQYLWHDHWEFDSELDYTRLLRQYNYKQFYYEVAPSLAVQRLFHVRDNLIFALSLQEAYHFTGVPSIFGTAQDVNDRLDSVLGATASWQPLAQFVLQPYYRFDETYYPHSFGHIERNDFLHTFGLAATWYFTPEFSARVYASESFRTSDDASTPSYSKFDGGVGLNLTLRF